jgi:alpha-tubulin suppressor-like RCC1 family protein
MKRTTVLLTLLTLIAVSLHAGQAFLAQGFSYNAITLTNDNLIYGWGGNTWGELGDNSIINKASPVLPDTSGVLSGKTIVKIARGSYFTVALDSDGNIYAWGNNTYGQFGNNTSDGSSTVAVATVMSGVLAGKTITDISAGTYHTVALDSDGKVYAWGHNTYGQLGNNSTDHSSIPVEVDTSIFLSGKTITAISAGQFFTLALDSDGIVYSWGRNNKGQLGINSTTDWHFPRLVDASGVLSGKIITKISAGEEHVLVLDSDGKAYSWGENSDGRCGDYSTLDRKFPVSVFMYNIELEGNHFTDISAGRTHSTALVSNGKVYSWGQNNQGQLGSVTEDPYSKFAVAVDTSGVLSGITITQIAAGAFFSMGMDSNGKLYTWGDNYYGELGNNDLGTDSFVPVSVVNSDNTEFALPITLSSFTATAVNGAVELAWETATETNNANFVIYRNDVSIASVAGAGTTTEPHSYSYVDDAVVPGVTYTYVLADVDYANEETKYEDDAVTVEIEGGALSVEDFVVGAAYPNPFNPTAVVPIELSRDAMVKASLYDLNGREVKALVNANFTAGTHDLRIDGAGLTTGLYLLQVVVDNVVDVQKIALMK